MKVKWNEADKFAFAHQKLRANQIPNKKREQNRKACRGQKWS
jgi:hypothetical protein